MDPNKTPGSSRLKMLIFMFDIGLDLDGLKATYTLD